MNPTGLALMASLAAHVWKPRYLKRDQNFSLGRCQEKSHQEKRKAEMRRSVHLRAEGAGDGSEGVLDRSSPRGEWRMISLVFYCPSFHTTSFLACRSSRMT
jgi:hypothetical protein